MIRVPLAKAGSGLPNPSHGQIPYPFFSFGSALRKGLGWLENRRGAGVPSECGIWPVFGDEPYRLAVISGVRSPRELDQGALRQYF